MAEKSKVLTIRAYSHDKGVRLYFQSDVFEEFFRSQHYGSGYTAEDYQKGWGARGYQLNTSPNHRNLNQLYYWGRRLYEGSRPNLSFLLAVGLTKGVTFNLNNTIVNERIIDKYVADLKNELKKLYNDYFTKIEYEEVFDL